MFCIELDFLFVISLVPLLFRVPLHYSPVAFPDKPQAQARLETRAAQGFPFRGGSLNKYGDILVVLSQLRSLRFKNFLKHFLNFAAIFAT